MSVFDAFLLRRDQAFLKKADVEESFGATMGHMSRGLAYLTQGVNQVAQLLDDYHKLESLVETAKKTNDEVIIQRDSAHEENRKISLEMEKLEKRSDSQSQRILDLEAQLAKACEDAIADFKNGGEFDRAVEEASIDKFGYGYEACLSLAEEKGVDVSVLQLADYAVAMAEVAKEPIVEDLTLEAEDLKGQEGEATAVDP